MTNTVWWILGLATVGGVAFFYSDSGKKLLNKAYPAKDLCIADLEDQKKKEVENAIKDKDVAKLTSFAKQADANGWKCAAEQIRSNINLIVSKCPNKDQVKIAVNDIVSGKLSIDGADKLAATLKKNGCTEQSKEILDAIELKKNSSSSLAPRLPIRRAIPELLGASRLRSLSSSSVISLLIGDIKSSVASIPEPDKSEIFEILKEYKTTSDFSKFKYSSGKILAYADVAAKYKATKAESQLRDLASKISSSLSKSEKSSNELRAEKDWPSIMSLPDNELSSSPKSAALCLIKDGSPYLMLSTGDGETVKGTAVVHLKQAIPGCAVDVDKLINVTNQIESKYGDTFSEAVAEMRLITDSLKRDLFTT